MEEELIRRAEDLRNRCERASVLTATAYLTPAEQAALTAWNARVGIGLPDAPAGWAPGL